MKLPYPIPEGYILMPFVYRITPENKLIKISRHKVPPTEWTILKK